MSMLWTGQLKAQRSLCPLFASLHVSETGTLGALGQPIVGWLTDAQKAICERVIGQAEPANVTQGWLASQDTIFHFDTATANTKDVRQSQDFDV